MLDKVDKTGAAQEGKLDGIVINSPSDSASAETPQLEERDSQRAQPADDYDDPYNNDDEED